MFCFFFEPFNFCMFVDFHVVLIRIPAPWMLPTGCTTSRDIRATHLGAQFSLAHFRSGGIAHRVESDDHQHGQIWIRQELRDWIYKWTFWIFMIGLRKWWWMMMMGFFNQEEPSGFSKVPLLAAARTVGPKVVRTVQISMPNVVVRSAPKSALYAS